MCLNAGLPKIFPVFRSYTKIIKHTRVYTNFDACFAFRFLYLPHNNHGHDLKVFVLMVATLSAGTGFVGSGWGVFTKNDKLAPHAVVVTMNWSEYISIGSTILPPSLDMNLLLIESRGD